MRIKKLNKQLTNTEGVYVAAVLLTLDEIEGLLHHIGHSNVIGRTEHCGKRHCGGMSLAANKSLTGIYKTINNEIKKL